MDESRARSAGSPGRELETARRLERGLAVLRWFAVVFGAVQVFAASLVEPGIPRDRATAVVAVIVFLAIGNAVLSMATSRATTAAQLGPIGITAFALDIVVITSVVWIGSYEAETPLWAAGYVLALEGAIRYRMGGALIGIGVTVASEPLREWYVSQTVAGASYDGIEVSFRLGIGLIIALVAGFMARSLQREAAWATDRARVAEESARREAAASRELGVFHSAVLAGVAARDLDSALQSMADSIAGDLGFEVCGIVLLEDGQLVTRGAHGLPDWVREPFPIGTGVSGRVAQTGRPILISDVTKDSAYLEVDPETRAEAAAPLIVGGEVIGVLNVESHTPFADPEAAMDLVSRLADQIALVVHREQLRARQRQTLERLRELDNLKSEFVAITSHELRTPLTSVRGFAKTLNRNLKRLHPDQVREFLTIIEKQSDRLTRLVDDLLLVSRIEAGRFIIAPEPIECQTFCADLLESFSEDGARLRLEVHVPEGETAWLVLDPHRLDQILRNLIQNGLKFSPPEAPVRLVVHVGRRIVQFQVHDRGVGIPPEEQERIFDRFHQAQPAMTRQIEGAGLGLYITKRLVEAMGGTIGVRSSPGEGSTFTVRLPVATEMSGEPADVEASETAGSTPDVEAPARS